MAFETARPLVAVLLAAVLLFTGGTDLAAQGGVSLAASVGDSEEFIGLRDYRPGDPLQKVHWKSFARTGKPIVREFQDEFFERHALILDTSSSRGEDAVFEEAIAVSHAPSTPFGHRAVAFVSGDGNVESGCGDGVLELMMERRCRRVEESFRDRSFHGVESVETVGMSRLHGRVPALDRTF